MDKARYPSGLRERSAKPRFAGSNPARASFRGVWWRDGGRARKDMSQTIGSFVCGFGWLQMAIVFSYDIHELDCAMEQWWAIEEGLA